MKCSFFCLFFFLWLPSIEVHADTIVLAADEWCPYNCKQNTTQEGYIIDIARAVFEKAGHTVIYKTTSWARAITDTRAGKITGVVGAVPEEVPGFILPKESLGTSQDHFYVTNKNPWRYKNIDSLAKVQLAVINGYAYNHDVFAFIAANKTSPRLHTASGEHALENNINMVIQGRVDALIEDYNVFTLTASKMGVINQLTDAGSSGTESAIYIAFSPNLPHSQEYADLLTTGINDLRKSGALQKIMARYSLTDWKK